MFTKNYQWKEYVDDVLGFTYEWAAPTVYHAYEGSIYSGGNKLYTLPKIDDVMNSFCTFSLKTGNSSASFSGVVFGDGTIEPTVEDVKLSGTQHTWISSSNSTKALSYSIDGNDLLVTVVYTINNTSGADATISEVGLCGCSSYKPGTSGSSRYLPILIEHTLLETPITIPADGVGKVTYTIRRSYATAE